MGPTHRLSRPAGVITVRTESALVAPTVVRDLHGPLAWWLAGGSGRPERGSDAGAATAPAQTVGGGVCSGTGHAANRSLRPGFRSGGSTRAVDGGCGRREAWRAPTTGGAAARAAAPSLGGCRCAEGGTPDPCHRDHPARPGVKLERPQAARRPRSVPAARGPGGRGRTSLTPASVGPGDIPRRARTSAERGRVQGPGRAEADLGPRTVSIVLFPNAIPTGPPDRSTAISRTPDLPPDPSP